jgi:hypothetical protein
LKLPATAVPSAVVQSTLMVVSLAFDSVTGNTKRVGDPMPTVPSSIATSPIEIWGSGSSFRIVPTPWESPRVAFVGGDRSTKNCSSLSTLRSP